MNLFYVSSTFQYICAEEARQHYQTKSDILLVEINPHHSHAQKQLEMINKDNWHEIILFEQNQRSLQLPKIIKKLSNNHELDNFFFAEYNSWLVNVIKKNIDFNKHIYFDDGTLTLYEYEKFIKNKTTYRRRRPIQDLLLYIQGIAPPREVPYFENLEIFTIFNIHNSSCRLTKNTLNAMRKSLPNTNLYNPNAPAGIIGQGAVGEHDNISIESYIRHIKEISNKHDNIIYFPHRSEVDEVKVEINKIKNITYHKSKSPLELEIAYEKIVLSCVYGMVSTALYTLAIAYKEIPIILIETKSSLGHDNNEIINKLQNEFNSINKNNL